MYIINMYIIQVVLKKQIADWIYIWQASYLDSAKILDHIVCMDEPYGELIKHVKKMQEKRQQGANNKTAASKS